MDIHLPHCPVPRALARGENAACLCAGNVQLPDAAVEKLYHSAMVIALTQNITDYLMKCKEISEIILEQESINSKKANAARLAIYNHVEMGDFKGAMDTLLICLDYLKGSHLIDIAEKELKIELR